MLRLFVFFILISFVITHCSEEEKPQKKKVQFKKSPENLKIKYFKDYKSSISGFNEYIQPINQEKAANQHHIRVYYNDKGQVFREEEYNSKSNFIRYSKYFYSKDIRVKEESYNEFDELLYIRYFNEDKRILKEESFSGGELNIYSLFNYNKKGLLTLIEQYSPSGYLTHYERYIYNKNRVLVKTEARNSNKKLIYYKKYNYEDNKLSHIDIYDGSHKKTNVYSVSEETDIDYNALAPDPEDKAAIPKK